MELLLWRHAEAEDLASDGTDLSRRLTPKGVQQAERMAKWLRAHGPREPRILVSPAVRTQQTAQALGMIYETVDRIAPGAHVADILAACDWSKQAKSRRLAVIIVGHQPTLGQVAASLVGGHENDWAVKKGALWWLSHRVRGGYSETVIRSVISADLL